MCAHKHKKSVDFVSFHWVYLYFNNKLYTIQSLIFLSIGISAYSEICARTSQNNDKYCWFRLTIHLAVFGTHIVLCVNEHFIARLIVFFSPRAVFRSSSLFLSVYPATVRARQYCAADSIEWTNRNEIVDCGVSIVYQRDGLRNNQMSEYRFFFCAAWLLLNATATEKEAN